MHNMACVSQGYKHVYCDSACAGLGNGSIAVLQRQYVLVLLDNHTEEKKFFSKGLRPCSLSPLQINLKSYLHIKSSRCMYLCMIVASAVVKVQDVARSKTKVLASRGTINICIPRR